MREIKLNYGIILLIVTYLIFIFGLLSPYSLGFSLKEVPFSIESIPSDEGIRFETTKIGIQTLFGVFNLIIVFLITLSIYPKEKSSGLEILFIMYVVSIILSKIFLGLGSLGGPILDKFLYGRYLLIFSTIALFILVYLKKNAKLEG